MKLLQVILVIIYGKLTSENQTLFIKLRFGRIIWKKKNFIKQACHFILYCHLLLTEIDIKVPTGFACEGHGSTVFWVWARDICKVSSNGTDVGFTQHQLVVQDKMATPRGG